MTLPLSGIISLAHIGYEAKKPLMSAVNINNSDVRKLPNIPGKTAQNSEISFADFYGATFGVGIGYGATDFVAVYNAALNVNTYSNLIYVVSVSVTPVSMVIASTSTAYFRINGGAWQGQAAIGSIKDGDALELYVTTSAILNTDCSVLVTFSGGSTKTWACWTLQGTGTADFTDVANATYNTSYTSFNNYSSQR